MYIVLRAWFFAWLFMPNFGYAHDEVLFDQYTLQASAEGEVVNDLMLVHLQVQHEDRDAKALADKVNEDMAWALDQLKEYAQIESDTRSYTTHPKYEQNRIVGWRSSQTLVIRGAEFEELKAALQKLQSRLQIQHVQFQPRDETRKQVEDELIQQALANFKHRATIVQDSMGASAYRVVQININTGGRGGQVRMQSSSTMALSRSVDSAPAVEAGLSKITVNISGQIQLQ